MVEKWYASEQRSLVVAAWKPEEVFRPCREFFGPNSRTCAAAAQIAKSSAATGREARDLKRRGNLNLLIGVSRTSAAHVDNDWSRTRFGVWVACLDGSAAARSPKDW